MRTKIYKPSARNTYRVLWKTKFTTKQTYLEKNKTSSDTRQYCADENIDKLMKKINKADPKNIDEKFTIMKEFFDSSLTNQAVVNELGYIANKNTSANNYREKNQSHILIYKNGEAITDPMEYAKLLIESDEHFNKTDNYCMYQNVISFDGATSERFRNTLSSEGVFQQQEVFELMKPIIENFILEQGFDLNNITWTGNFHTNTDHIHFHLDYNEIKPTRVKNKLDNNVTEKNRRKMEHAIAPEELKVQLDNLYLQEKSIVKELNKNIEFSVHEAIQQHENYDKLKNKIEEQNAPYLAQANEEIKELVGEMGEDISNDFLKEYKDVLEQISKVQSKIYGTDSEENLFTDNNIEKMQTKISNNIYKSVKNDIKLEKVKKQNEEHKKDKKTIHTQAYIVKGKRLRKMEAQISAKQKFNDVLLSNYLKRAMYQIQQKNKGESNPWTMNPWYIDPWNTQTKG